MRHREIGFGFLKFPCGSDQLEAFRLQAKELELGSTERIESSAKDNARFDSFENTHQHIQDEMTGASMSSLNEVSF